MSKRPKAASAWWITSTITLAIAAIAGLSLWWAGGCAGLGICKPSAWTEAELQLLQSLSLNQLPPPLPSPSNRVADNPQAADFGHRLFFDARLSATGTISCATCHQPERNFTDGKARGEGIGTAGRNTMSIVGSAYSPWLYWDGRSDSLWSQALAPLEDPAEHGGHRMQYLRLVAEDLNYRHTYEALFGPLPAVVEHLHAEPASQSPEADWQAHWQTMAEAARHEVNRFFANMGKAIAAYERLLLPGASRFDAYVDALLAGNTVGEDSERQAALFSADEIRGLRIFIGKGRCIDCHNGPLFTNNEFHNTGVLSFAGELPDRGRRHGAAAVLTAPFNCTGAYSDAAPEDCAELRYMREGKELLGAMRTPSLRNLAGTAPFMHKGQLATLADVLEHYNKAPAAMIGHSEAKPLGLRGWELKALEAFLQTLAAPLATDPKWLRPPVRSEG
jgi:cytochrome c peroxidase